MVALPKLSDYRCSLVDLALLVSSVHWDPGLRSPRTDRAMKFASSPWAVYQSPRSNIRIVSSPTVGRDLKKRMKPCSSST